MTDSTPTQAPQPIDVAAIDQLLKARLAAMLGQQPQPQATVGMGFGQPAAPSPFGAFGLPAGGPPVPSAMHVPIKLELPGGASLRLYLAIPLDQQTASNPQAISAVVQQLGAMLPLDVWQPRQSGGWGGGNGGGYQQTRGGFGGRRW